MASAVLLGRALELDADPANLLGLAALVLLADRPAAAADVGFQLSFGATLGILALAGPAHSRRAPPAPARGPRGRGLGRRAVRPRPGPRRLVPPPRPRRGPAEHRGGAALRRRAARRSRGPARGAPRRRARRSSRATSRGSRPARCACRATSARLGPWLDLRVAAPSLRGRGALRGRPRPALPGPPARRPRAAARRATVVLVAGRLSRPADGRLHLTVIDVGQGDSLAPALALGARPSLVDAGGSSDPRFDPGERRVAPGAVASGRAPSRRPRRHARPPRPRRGRALPAARVPRGGDLGGPGAPPRPGLAARGSRSCRRGRGARSRWPGAWASTGTASGSTCSARSGRASRPPRVRNEDSVVLDVVVRRGASSAHRRRRRARRSATLRCRPLVRAEGAAPREPHRAAASELLARRGRRGWPSSRPGRTTRSATLTPKSSSAIVARAPSSCGRTGTAPWTWPRTAGGSGCGRPGRARSAASAEGRATCAKISRLRTGAGGRQVGRGPPADGPATADEPEREVLHRQRPEALHAGRPPARRRGRGGGCRAASRRSTRDAEARRRRRPAAPADFSQFLLGLAAQAGTLLVGGEGLPEGTTPARSARGRRAPSSRSSTC